MGPLAIPGRYQATLMKRQNGVASALGQPVDFTLKSMANSPEISQQPEQVLAFKQELAELQRATNGTNRLVGEMDNRIKHMRKAIDLTPASDENMAQELRAINSRLADLKVKLRGDATVASRQEATPWSISQRVGSLYGGLIESQADIPGNYRESLKIAKTEFAMALKELRMIEADLQAVEDEAERIGAPWTPGRVPHWD